MSDAMIPTRRAVLQGAGAATLAGFALTACGGDDSQASDSSGQSAPETPTVVGKSSDVPVGGGVVFSDAKVVVTQPTAGQFKGFSTRCTHQGCAVTRIADGFILCPCHNSRFAVADGSPTPDSQAKQPLASVAVTVSGGEITAG